MYVTKPRILQYMSHYTNFSDVCRKAQNSLMYVTQPSFLLCQSHSPEFSNVCHTTQYSPMYVTPLSLIQCRSHHSVLSNVGHNTQVWFNVGLTTHNSLVHIIPPVFLQCMSQSPVFSDSLSSLKDIAAHLDQLLINDLTNFKQGRVQGYPSHMRVGRSSAGEGHKSIWAVAVGSKSSKTPKK